METTNEELSYVPMYKSYIDAVAKLTPEDRLVIYEAIFEYGFTGTEPTFDNPYLEMGWNLVKPNLVNNIKRMQKNKSAANGAKGGRPKKVVEIKQELPKETPKALSTKTEQIVSEIKEVALQSIFGEQRTIIDEIQEREEEETYSMIELMKDIISEDETDEVFDFHCMLGNKLNKSTFTKNEIGIGISIAKSDNSISNEVLNKITETIKTI